METERLTAESAAIFHEGIWLTLCRWVPFDLAVQHGCDSPESRRAIADLLCSHVFSSFTGRIIADPRCRDDLERLLGKGLFRLRMLLEDEDDSTREVAENLRMMYQQCLQGNYQTVFNLRISPDRSRLLISDKHNVVRAAADAAAAGR